MQNLSVSISFLFSISLFPSPHFIPLSPTLFTSAPLLDVFISAFLSPAPPYSLLLFLSLFLDFFTSPSSLLPHSQSCSSPPSASLPADLCCTTDLSAPCKLNGSHPIFSCNTYICADPYILHIYLCSLCLPTCLFFSY